MVDAPGDVARKRQTVRAPIDEDGNDDVALEGTMSLTHTIEPAVQQDAAVKFSEVYKAFVGRGRNKDAHLALSDVSFTAKPGEFISLVGPSGCGKSTCLNLLAGLDSASDGEVAHLGKPVSGINTSVGYITQDDNLLPWRSLHRNVALGLPAGAAPELLQVRQRQVEVEEEVPHDRCVRRTEPARLARHLLKSVSSMPVTASAWLPQSRFSPR